MKSEGDTINESEMQEDRMFNVIKLAREAIDALDHDIKDLEFHDGHLSARAKVTVGDKVYDATLTIDEEVPETPLSDG